MRASLVVLAFCVAVAFALPPPELVPRKFRGGQLYRDIVREANLHATFRNSSENFMTQYIDHSNPSVGTFRQRYFIDNTYWTGEGPVMLYFNGEAPASGSPRGYITSVAKELHALLITLEHRYYGRSMPAPLTNKAMLKYLTVDQSLADHQAFYEYYSDQVIGKRLKWIAVGGSYAGALSAWTRAKYPSSFIASWSSSGVVNSIFDFYHYENHIKNVLSTNCEQRRQGCLPALHGDVRQPRHPAASRRHVPHPARLYPRRPPVDVGRTLVRPSVQYGRKQAMCNMLLPVAPDPLRQFARMVDSMLGSSFASNCQYRTACLMNASKVDEWLEADYPWLYQICSELGWWQIGFPGGLRPAEIDTTYFMEQCKAVFWPHHFPRYICIQPRPRWGTPQNRQGHCPARLGRPVEDRWCLLQSRPGLRGDGGSV